MDIAQKQKIRIKLKSYDPHMITESCNQIINAALRTNASIIGPVAFPTKRKLYCVLRSPHVDKDSREHFEIRTHSRMIDVYALSSQTIDSLMKLNIPAGVDIEVKL